MISAVYTTGSVSGSRRVDARTSALPLASSRRLAFDLAESLLLDAHQGQRKRVTSHRMFDAASAIRRPATVVDAAPHASPNSAAMYLSASAAARRRSVCCSRAGSRGEPRRPDRQASPSESNMVFVANPSSNCRPGQHLSNALMRRSRRQPRRRFPGRLPARTRDLSVPGIE